MDIFDQITDSKQAGGDIFDRISTQKQSSAISQLGQALGTAPKTLIRGVAEPLIRNVIARPVQAAESAITRQPPIAFDYPFPKALGGDIRVEPIKTIPQGIGAGLQTAALGLSPVAGGVAYGAGQALEEEKSGYDVVGQGLFGAGLGKALGMMSGEALFTGKAGQVISDKIKGASSATSARVVNSLVKPLLKDFSYGKNPGLGVAQEGIVANSLDELAKKVSISRQNIGKQINDTLTKPGYQQLRLNITKDITPLDEAMQTAAKQNNQTLINRLQEVRRAITQKLTLDYVNGQPLIKTVGSRNLSNLTPLEAMRIKQEIGDLTKWTGNASDDQFVNKALKQTYGNIKERVGSAVPAVKGLNERYANLTSAENAIKYRDKIEQRQNLIGVVPKLIGAGEAMQFLATGDPRRILEGIAAIGIGKVLGSPAFKTRLAVGLSKLSKSDLLKVGESSPLLMNFIKQSGVIANRGGL